MFSLLAGLWRLLFQKTEHFVLIIGCDGAGKTTLMEQAKRIFSNQSKKEDENDNDLDGIGPTVGLNIGKIDQGKVRLVVWDLGGQSGLRFMWDRYYSECDGVVFVVDSAESSRFDEAKKEIQQAAGHTQLHEVPLLVLANKQDLTEALPAETVEGAVIDMGVKSGRKFLVQGVSALKGTGVKMGLEWLVQQIRAGGRRKKR
uniref:Uncharacterized protein n=2 Tax=Palpitomonas bilix TaxID=652834 RepID=A0A7S3LTQ4_9EUKA|mmetsp:Transcript_45344/g.117370  ORF Transcript_45344/g.117370 Transcript_45344/m.117370 type:complete len:201 (+) Transcript_45344:349-951(+)